MMLWDSSLLSKAKGFLGKVTRLLLQESPDSSPGGREQQSQLMLSKNLSPHPLVCF